MSEVETSNDHLKSLERDAKRYRFMRQMGDPNFDTGLQLPPEPNTPEEFDAGIDWLITMTGFEK